MYIRIIEDYSLYVLFCERALNVNEVGSLLLICEHMPTEKDSVSDDTKDIDWLLLGSIETSICKITRQNDHSKQGKHNIT